MSKPFTFSVWNTVWELRDVQEFTLPLARIKNKQILAFYETPNYKISYGKIARIGVENSVAEISTFYETLHEEPQLTWDPICGRTNYVLYDYPAMILSENDIKDLRVTIENFVKDVNNRFKIKNYLKEYWWKPFVKKINK